MTLSNSTFGACLVCLIATQITWAQLPASDPPASTAINKQESSNHGYDLQHVVVELDVEYSGLTFRGVVTNTVVPLRSGLNEVCFHCGENLQIDHCEVGGQDAKYARRGEILSITPPGPLTEDQAVEITIHYRASGVQPRGFFWIRDTLTNRSHAGFYTHSQPDATRSWVPTWDQPDDFATTETRVTVPADWYVVGNGILDGNELNSIGSKRTFHWVMDEPHATYLLSLAAGPFDIVQTRWRNVPLSYVVPKGKGAQADYTFQHTPDILAFYSDRLGVAYPWPKYAQTIMYDYRDGLENVSATTLAEGALTGARDGDHQSDATIAHELAHQWFGDLVTCQNWGDLWLNEGFAVYLTELYMEHSRGRAVFDQDLRYLANEYFAESHRYERSLSVRDTVNPRTIFDRHAYGKGAFVLHMLRRTLGDEKFFAGLRQYLLEHAHKPVSSRDLCVSLTGAAGFNLAPFFDQWVYRSGHPVLDFTWTWDKAQHSVVAKLKQLQVDKGGDAYDLSLKIGLISDAKVQYKQVNIDKAEQEIRFPAVEQPEAVLLDPDHDLLIEIPDLHWSTAELPAILKSAPNTTDREEAMRRILNAHPSDESIASIIESLRADSESYPALRWMGPLTSMRRADLRPFFREQLTHANISRRAEAIRALGKLPPDETDIRTLRDLAVGTGPYKVVRAAVYALAALDAAHNRAVFEKAAEVSGDNLSVRLAAYDALSRTREDSMHGDPKVEALLRHFLEDVASGTRESSSMTPTLSEFLIPNFSRGTAATMKDLQSFTCLAREAATDEVRGAQIRESWYYKVGTSRNSLYYIFRLTPDGKVGDIDIYPCE